MAVKHTTPADGTFSASGTTAWNENHTIEAGTVTLAMQANMDTASLVYRKTAGAGAPEVNTLATLKTDLGLTGTNSGDQTSIVGISGTIAQFNTACSDADFATGGGTATGTNTGDNATNSQYSGLVSNATHTGDATGATGLTVVAINGTNMAALATGILKNTTTTGVPSIAVAGDFPTLNQNTSGTAAGLSATLAVGSGGTNLTTIADSAILATNSANVLTAVTAGASQSIRRNAGNTAWEAFTPGAGGGATLDGITAATADQAGIANADWNVRWNWAKITNTEVAFELGESAAATGGTSTAGVPNQVLAKFSTLAASTMSPLSVYSRAAHVFSVSPTTAQVLFTAGSASVPSIGYAAQSDVGIAFTTAPSILFCAGGSSTAVIDLNGSLGLWSGIASAPAIFCKSSLTTGVSFPGNTSVAMYNVGVENARFSAGLVQMSKGTADSVAYAINARKARGTVASPTVITTGDDLLDINAYGYVGATNTYQLAAGIKFDSTGAISDSATGIGGIIRFNAATVGAEPVECCSVQSGSFVTAGYTVATLPVGVTGAIVHVTDQLTAVAAKGVAPTGGGAVVCMVFYNGTAWVGI